MEGQRLIFKNGMVVEDGRAGQDGNTLWLWIPGMTMQEVAGFAFDPSVMGKVIAQYGEEEDVFAGFTDCTVLIRDTNEINVCMAKG